MLLAKPVTEKETVDGAGSAVRYGSSAMQGWRTGMEDAHVCVVDAGPNKDASFFAVFDGHGGYEVSRYCARHLHEVVFSSEAFQNGHYEDALIQGYLAMDSMMASEEGINELTEIRRVHSDDVDALHVRKCQPEGVGSTAVCALLVNSTLYVGNAGDSRCVLSRDGQAVEMSVDHKPSLEGESRRIAEAGGYVVNGRVNGNLNLTRALGDQDYKKNRALGPEKQIISGYPDVRVMPLTSQDEFFVLACDGIWDCMSSQDVVNFFRAGIINELKKDANSPKLSTICESALDRCLSSSASNLVGCDNMSVTVTAFQSALPRLANLPEVDLSTLPKITHSPTMLDADPEDSDGTL